jgi:hypothetical protein
MEHIDLRRNFIAIGKDAEPDLSIGRNWGRKYGGWLAWPDLLNHPRVVLLAEAASGKSEEFKHTAAELRSRGSPAFYTTIEQLADDRLPLDPTEKALFEQWKSSAGDAWFLLDSVDAG